MARCVSLNSEDVILSYCAIMNPLNAVPSRSCYDRVASIKASGPYTVVVTLKHLYSPIVACFFGGDSNYPILPAHLLAHTRASIASLITPRLLAPAVDLGVGYAAIDWR